MTDISTFNFQPQQRSSSESSELFLSGSPICLAGSLRHMWELWSCVGVVDMCGICGYVWELWLCVGKLGVAVSLLLSILSVA